MKMIDDPDYYSKQINITSTMAGAMVEQTFYTELNDQFISILCSATDNVYSNGQFNPTN